VIVPPRPPSPSWSRDDDAIDLPSLDGEAGEAASDLFADEAARALVGDDDSPAGLEDEIAAEEAAEAWIEPLADVESEGWETGEADPLDADPELEAGEAEAWTEGSDEDASAPIELEVSETERAERDEGGEGPDDERVEDLALPPTRDADREDDEGYADDLDVGVTLPERRGEDDAPETGEVE
jgi:hypothetical protein